MIDRFPELKSVPLGAPPDVGFLDGLFFVGNICLAAYGLLALAVALGLTGLPFAARLLARFVLWAVIAGTICWAVLVPGGLWTLLIPILTPAATLACLIVRFAVARPHPDSPCGGVAGAESRSGHPH